MQPTRPTPRKGQKFLDAKIFIITLSLAITIGLWNLFSNNAIQTVKSAAGDSTGSASQAGAYAAAGSPPLPTLVPLVAVEISGNDSAGAVSQSVQSAPLRAVAVPTMQIVQKHAPLVGQPAQVSSGGGGGGGGGSQSAPVTITRSSR